MGRSEAEAGQRRDDAPGRQDRRVPGQANRGPPPFACKAAHYKESDFTADLLFQGAFDEMRSKNKSVDPDKLAASLDFSGKKIRTLETGCEIDFHFVDAATAEIGLNEYVYTMKKQ